MFNISDRISLITPNLIKRKPLFLLRMGLRILYESSNIFKPLFGSSMKIRSVLFHTHYKCNLNCAHCYEKNFFKNESKPMTFKEKLKVINELSNLGAISFDFVAGESILDEHLEELVKACKPYKTYVGIATNGTCWTEEKVQRLFDLGVDKLNISMDSYFAEEHDKMRRTKGVYDKVFKLIEICKKVGIAYRFTLVVYKNSTKTKGFKYLIDYVVRNHIPVGIKIALPLGNWNSRNDVLTTKEDKETIRKLHEKYPQIIQSCHIGNTGGGCPAFKDVIAISAYGDIMPCNGIHISFGNIRKDNIEDVLEKGRKISHFNGKYRGCLAGQNRYFIDTYLSKTFNAKQYPIKAEEVFKMNKSWKDEIVLITGATSGLGKALALRFGDLGATVVGISRNVEGLIELKEQIKNFTYENYDLNDVENINLIYKSIVKKVGHPTILINCVGNQTVGFVKDVPLNEYENVFRLNTLAPIALIQQALPEMINKNEGTIINIYSSIMYHSYPGKSAYTMSKKALQAMTESLRLELANTNINVMSVRPGSMKTNYWKNTKNYIDDYKLPEAFGRDPNLTAKAIIDAVEKGKSDVDIKTLKDRIAYHLGYWSPKMLENMLKGSNKKIIDMVVE